jgi:hypothetical protein
MTIPKIGGAFTPPTMTRATTPATGLSGKPFDLHRATAGATHAPGEPTPLEQLRAGHIDHAQYADAKIDTAISRVKGISPAQQDELREMLRERLASDDELGAFMPR